MSEKELKLYSCFLDLKRAAIYFYKNPKGKTYRVFLDNALETISQVKDKNLDKYKKDILNFQIITNNNYSKDQRMNIADDILTTGILLKSLASTETV